LATFCAGSFVPLPEFTGVHWLCLMSLIGVGLSVMRLAFLLGKTRCVAAVLLRFSQGKLVPCLV
jgi:hypothetical protein